MSDTLKIIPLGGMGEVTKNMFAYETDQEILIIDCGIGFPDQSMPGVDLLLPDISYLEDKLDKIVGILLTHAHDDHIAGLPYILPKLPTLPIYASRLTKGFAMDRCKEGPIKPEITEIDESEFSIGSFHIKPLKVTHSVPDGRHFVIRTPNGSTVYHGSDYKFDETPVDGAVSDYDAMKKAGDEGVDLMLSDSLRSERSGVSKSESLLKETFEKEIQSTKGKFIVTLMSSNIHRIQQAVDVAHAHGRKLAFVGRSIEQNIKTAQNLGFLRIPSNPINKRKIDQMSPKDVCIIIAGSQGQVGSSLERAARNDHNMVFIDKEDKVVFATEPIPGNETFLYDTLDNISRIGCEMAYPEIRDETLHVSGHGNAEEIKRLMSLVKPKYMMPIGGAYRHMVQYKKLAIELGYKGQDILVLDNGETLSLSHEGAKKGKKINISDVIVDGSGIGDVGTIVLSDRKRMADSGMVVILLLLERKTGRLIGNPEIISRGFVYMKASKKLLSSLNAQIRELVPRKIAQKDWSNIRNNLERKLQKSIYKEIERSPLILPVIKEV